MAFNAPQGGFRTPSPYDRELSSIAKRERMAQIMQQQALQPLEINSYQGIQAPISPLQGIAKILQAYVGMNASEKADESRSELGKRIQTEGAEQIASLEGRPMQPAIAPTAGTSFTPTGADFEDNTNLPVAASGNVEVAGSPGRPAIPAMPLGDAEKRQRLIQILTGGNPYAAPAAKFMLEDMQKSGTGPLAEYKLYSEQAKARGETPLSIDAYKTRQIQAGRAISNNVVNMPAGAPITAMVDGQLRYVQMAKDGKYTVIEGAFPVQPQTTLAQELLDAGITRDNPQFQELAQAYLNKKLLINTPAGTINTTGTQKPPAFVPDVPKGGSLNPENVDERGNLIVTETPGASNVTAGQQASQAYGTASGANAADRDKELYAVATKAPETINQANRLISLIDSGAITGTAAESKLALAKALNITGKGDNERIKNTELLISGLGQNVLNNVRASGLGAGQGFTDNDRKFLERVVGGSIELNASTIRELSRLAKMSAANSIQQWNSRIADIPPNVVSSMGLRKIEAPSIYSPSDIDAELKRRGLK